MSDKFKYTTGLHNVGSYLVAGSPYVTSSVVEADTEKQITFPRVTNNVTVKLDSAAGQTFNSLYMSASAGGASLRYTQDTASVNNVQDGDERSISLWISASGQTNAIDNGILVGEASNNSNFCLREKNRTIQFSNVTSAGTKVIASAVVFPTTDWIHVVGTIKPTASFLYINGSQVASNTDVFNTEAIRIGNTYQIGTQNAEFEGEYKFRDIIIWDIALSASEVTTLYQSSGSATGPAGANRIVWIKPSDPIGIDVATLSNSYQGTTINTGSFHLNDHSVSEVADIVAESPFDNQEASGGELRVHYRSTGSLPNVANRKHYWTLDAQDEEIKMNVKTKEIYLSAVGGVCDFSVHADLTNIPTARMYEHTGSGVDE